MAVIFFARVIPSNGMDTLCAVKTLKLLGSKQIPREDVLRFFRAESREGNLYNVTSIYFAIKAFKLLKAPLTEFSPYLNLVKSMYHNKSLFKKKNFQTETDKQFSLTDTTTNTLYLDLVEGKAKDLFYLTSLLCDLEILLILRK